MRGFALLGVCVGFMGAWPYAGGRVAWAPLYDGVRGMQRCGALGTACSVSINAGCVAVQGCTGGPLRRVAGGLGAHGSPPLQAVCVLL